MSKKGRPSTSIFRLYDIETGELFMEGSSKELGEAIGAGKEAIRQAYEKNWQAIYKGYEIEAVDGDDQEDTKTDAEVIASWNAFVEPLRKKYGIPVRRFTKEELEGKGRGK